VKRRYYRWIEQGVIDRMFEAASDDPDIEWLAIDATVIRAQAQAAGARVKKGALKRNHSHFLGWLLSGRAPADINKQSKPCLLPASLSAIS
jgi:hypothetical protein